MGRCQTELHSDHVTSRGARERPRRITQQRFGDSSSAVSGERICWRYVQTRASPKSFNFMESSSYDGGCRNFWTPTGPRCACLWRRCAACSAGLLTWSSLASGQDLTNSDYLRLQLEIALFQQRATPWLATPNGATYFMSVQKTNCQKYRNMDLSGFWSVEKSRIHQLRSLAHVTHLTKVNFQG